MADSFTQVPADSTGDKIDMEELTVGANTVNRQRVQIAGTGATEIADIATTTPGASDNGLVVRHAGDVNIADGGNSITVDDGGTTVSVDDGGGTLTVDGTVAVSSVTTSVTPGTAAANLGKAVDAVAGASDTGVAPLAVRDDALATLTPIDGDYTHLRTNDRGALWTKHDGVVSVDDNGGSLTVDGATLTTIAGAVSGTEMQVDVVASLPAGTNNIGDVDIASALPSGSNNIGTVRSDIVTPTDNGTALTVSFASVDVATSGDNTIVAAQGAGNAVRVLSYVLVASGGANTVTWKSGASTAKSGGMGLASTGGISADSTWGLIQTADNEALVLNLSAATSVDGHITYTVV